MEKYSTLTSMGPKETCVGRCVWGPTIWDSLMIFATTYTPDKKQAFLAYVNSLKYLLPCDFCKVHFEENIRKRLPIVEADLVSNETLMVYVYKLHDLVNRQINAYNLAHGINAHPKKSPSYPEVRDYWVKKLL